jgi:hypothetical protein
MHGLELRTTRWQVALADAEAGIEQFLEKGVDYWSRNQVAIPEIPHDVTAALHEVAGEQRVTVFRHELGKSTHDIIPTGN